MRNFAAQKLLTMLETIALINEMSPYLLLGFLLAGVMHVYVPARWFRKYLSGHNLRSVFYAALFGVPLPLCSCGVLPTAMSLRKEGASHGATVSFLIATPQTGIDSIAATYALMGLPFAVLRPVAAFLTALFGGWAVNAVQKPADGAPGGEPQHEEAHACSCCHCHEKAGQEPQSAKGAWQKVREVLAYAYLEMMEDIGKWLVAGLVAAGLITVFVPDSFFAVFRDNSFLSMLLVLAIAIPMYICATGSIPIAVALMLKGLTPGAGLVLLMAGPACNVASLLVIGRSLGRRTLAAYLLSIIAGSVGFGLLIDHFLPRNWFVPTLLSQETCPTEAHAGWLGAACSVLLVLLLINAFIHSRRHGHDHSHGHGSCCAGEGHA